MERGRSIQRSSIFFPVNEVDMALIIGIDVGGTHADGVLLDGKEILLKKKVLVDHEELSGSVLTLLRELVPESGENLSAIHLSTTLCTNSVINDTLDQVGMLIQSGPGMNPDFLKCGDHAVFLDGAVDHRGHVVKDPDEMLIDEAASVFRRSNIDSIGIVTKFSQRNNIHETRICERLKPRFSHISMGHRLSGLPNFPRRVYTTWLNAALKSQFKQFREAITAGLDRLDVKCPCLILKADGGTMPFPVASSLPCETVLSGPSASVMGCLALHPGDRDAILLDIGGTTTDIAILADGVPLFEPYGVTIQERPTLIRALNTRSIGLGGDSRVVVNEGRFIIGPERSGPPMALGGAVPTPTDAMIVLGSLNAGSTERAMAAMEQLVPGQDVKLTARNLLTAFAEQVRQAVDNMIDDVFSRPVYTVAALLNRKRLDPHRIIAVGGPAVAMQQALRDCFSLDCVVPEHFEVANAVGAARTRPTLEATLYADTADGNLSIPEIGCQETILPSFDLQAAKDRLWDAVVRMGRDSGLTKIPDIVFTEEQVMNTVRGFTTSGRIISLKAQIQPDLDLL